MHVLRVSIVPFLLLKQFKYEVTLEFQQKQGCMQGSFCRFHMATRPKHLESDSQALRFCMTVKPKMLGFGMTTRPETLRYDYQTRGAGFMQECFYRFHMAATPQRLTVRPKSLRSSLESGRGVRSRHRESGSDAKPTILIMALVPNTGTWGVILISDPDTLSLK